MFDKRSTSPFAGRVILTYGRSLMALVIARSLAQRGIETPLLAKMAFGAFIVAASYVALGVVAAWSESHGVRASWLWLFAWFVIFTIGELYILPTGLALFGQMAPAGFRATSIATWFFAGFFGNLLAGGLGTLWGEFTHGWFFVLIGAIAGLSALLLYGLSRRMGSLATDELAGAKAALAP